MNRKQRKIQMQRRHAAQWKGYENGPGLAKRLGCAPEQVHAICQQVWNDYKVEVTASIHAWQTRIRTPMEGAW